MSSSSKIPLKVCLMSVVADPDNESGLAVDVAPLETMAGELPRSCPVSICLLFVSH